MRFFARYVWLERSGDLDGVDADGLAGGGIGLIAPAVAERQKRRSAGEGRSARGIGGTDAEKIEKKDTEIPRTGV